MSCGHCSGERCWNSFHHTPSSLTTQLVGFLSFKIYFWLLRLTLNLWDTLYLSPGWLQLMIPGHSLSEHIIQNWNDLLDFSCAHLDKLWTELPKAQLCVYVWQEENLRRIGWRVWSSWYCSQLSFRLDTLSTPGLHCPLLSTWFLCSVIGSGATWNLAESQYLQEQLRPGINPSAVTSQSTVSSNFDT